MRRVPPTGQVFAAGGGADEGVHYAVGQEVDLVHVEDIAVGLGQQAGLKHLFSLFDGLLHVQRAHHTILGGPDREFHYLPGAGNGFPCRFFPAGFAEIPGLRAAVERTALYHLHLVQKAGEPPDGGGFGAALFPLDEDSAQGGVDEVEHQGQLHLLLAHDGSKRIEMLHIMSLLVWFLNHPANRASQRSSARATVTPL